MNQSTTAISAHRELDLLVADIADLARCSATRSAGQVAVQLPSMDSDQQGLLDAVRTLLGSALEKMRMPSAAAAAAARDTHAPASLPPRGGIAPSALRRVREHIDRSLAEHIEIADLATITGLSACHFSRAFKQSMGMPPHRYLTSRRVREAARLIESTDKSMSEIALDVGFSDQSHFTRVFSALVGESPSQFRHQRR